MAIRLSTRDVLKGATILVIGFLFAYAMLVLLFATAEPASADSTTATVNPGVTISDLRSTLTARVGGPAVDAFKITSTGATGVTLYGYPTSYGAGINWSFASAGLTPGTPTVAAVYANSNVAPGTYHGEAILLIYPSNQRVKVADMTITVESPASADSPSTPYAAIVPPGQFIKLVREADERVMVVGQSARATRLFPDRTFRDRIIIKNEMAVAADNAAIMGYWSTPTLIFRGWSGEGWELDDPLDPQRYVAKYLKPIPAGEAVELAIEFQIKEASAWRHLRDPQAEHAIAYRLVYPEGGLLHGEEKVLSSLIALEPNLKYGWGTAPGQFFYHRHQAQDRSSRKMLTANLHGPYTVQSFDADLPSTHMHFNGASGQACETKVHPEIRAGEVTLHQGWCLIGQFSHYPYLREDAKGNRLNSHGEGPLLWTLLGVPESNNPSSPWYAWQAYAEPGSQGLVIEVWSNRAITIIKIPRGQALELTVQWPLESTTYRSYTVWNDKNGWWWKSGKASPAEGEPMWSLWNLNTLTLHKDGRAEYTELPFRRPS